MKLSTTDAEKPSILGVKIWVIKCFLASVSMGTGMFLSAVNFSKYGLGAQAYIGPIPFIWLSLIKIFYALRNKWQIGTFINYEKSNLFTPEGTFRTKNMIPLLGSVYGNVAHRFLYALAFKYAVFGGINQGVIPILNLAASIINAVSFYCAFGEVLSCIKIIGMCVALSSVV